MSFSFRRFGPDPRKLVPQAQEARINLIGMVNRRGLDPGLRVARNPATTPKLTGQLIRSITWSGAKRTGQDVQGDLTVGVVYGRRQEFEHFSKRLYMLRAIQQAHAALGRDLTSSNLIRRLGGRVIEGTV